MYLPSRTNRRILRVLSLVSLAALAGSLPGRAQGTHLWTQSRIEDFEKGTPVGVAVSSDGRLREGPALAERLTTASTAVWSVAVNATGTAWLGTSGPATVVRVGADGKSFVLFESKDLSVQVVRLGPDGALYAATLPGGRVYRIKADATEKVDESSAAVVFDAARMDEGKAAAEQKKSDDGKAPTEKPEARSHYVWDMTFDAAGRLYIATGGPGVVYRVDAGKPDARPEVFFRSDEQHIRALAWDAKGNLIAGSDGSGLVYRINPAGKGYVLFEAPRREITSVAVAANGTIYAASVGDKSRNPLPPLPVQGVGSVSFTVMQPGSLQAANASTTVPEGTEIWALSEGQAPRKLWAGKDEIVYALAARRDGLLALSGNRGRILKIGNDGSWADVGRLEAQLGLCLAELPEAAGANALLVGTGNTGKLYRLGGGGGRHEFASDVLDAGALARYGRVEVQPGSANYDLWTRTGNVEQPARGRNDWGWSEWEPLKDGAVASPTGRFLQWKVTLHPGGTVGGVAVNYLPVNAAPVVDDLVVAVGARLSAPSQAAQPATVNIVFAAPAQNPGVTFDNGSAQPLQAVKDRTAVTVRWGAHDDNGDDLTFALHLRGDGEKTWRLLKDGLTEKAYSFDATLIPDGGYQIRVVASDAPSHTPGDALTGSKESERFEVDTTAPVVSGLTAECAEVGCGKGLHVRFTAEDAFSPLARAEYSLNAGPWQFIEPVGGLSDARREEYDFRIPAAGEAKSGEQLVTVRVYDRHDNVGVAKTVIAAEAK